MLGEFPILCEPDAQPPIAFRTSEEYPKPLREIP